MLITKREIGDMGRSGKNDGYIYLSYCNVSIIDNPYLKEMFLGDRK